MCPPSHLHSCGRSRPASRLFETVAFGFCSVKKQLAASGGQVVEESQVERGPPQSTALGTTEANLYTRRNHVGKSSTEVRRLLLTTVLGTAR